MAQPKGTAKPKFEIGDRVQEKKKHGVVVATCKAEEIAGTYNSLRVGKVTAISTKRDKRGHTYFYYEVLWDYLKSPTVHSQMRLLPADGSSV